MQRRGVRLGLTIAFLCALGATGWLFWSQHQKAVGMENAAREFESISLRARSAVDDAWASLVAAMVPGQGEDYWLPRSAASLEAARSSITQLKQQTADGSALNDLDAAAAALDQMSAARNEVARYLRSDLRTQASRLVFGEVSESAGTAATRIAGARETVRLQGDAGVTAAGLTQWIALGLTAAMALVLIGLLIPVSEATTTEGAAVTAPDAAGEETSTAAPAAPPAEEGAPALAAAPAQPEAETDHVPQDGATLPRFDRRKAPELRAAADLCTDFGRLVDPGEMPGLLERAARLLDATGFIVWLADGDGSQLQPALAYGFPPQALRRLPAIPRHADNATAAAYRHGEMQVVRTNGMTPGAIVVPIVGPAGCVGAMAAEVRHGREASESARALARIVAAQLATLVSSQASQQSPVSSDEISHAQAG
jgi:hypothetical protein